MTNNIAYQAWHFSSFYTAAAERTLCQFISALWFEGTLLGHLEQSIDGKTTLYLQGRDEQGQQFGYRIQTYPSDSFGRHRLHGALVDIDSGMPNSDIATVATNLLGSIKSQHRWRFINELIHTAAKQAYSLLALQARIQVKNVDSLLELPYALQEAQLGEGHLYHPCYRSRVGFDLIDHQRYGPEFAQKFALVWLALDKRLGAVHGVTDEDYLRFLEVEIGRENLLALQSAICDAGKDAGNYYLLPVHPWHWQHSVQIQYADWLADGRLLYLGTDQTSWLAQQSIRSLTSLAGEHKHHLKLPLAIANSSADRILSDHHVHNAPLISACLLQLRRDDLNLQQQARLEILAEPMGISLKPDASNEGRYGLLGAIWRQPPSCRLKSGERAFPCTALTVAKEAELEAELIIAPWLQQHGSETWVAALLKAMLPPFIHLMIAHGILLEAHAQNTVLIVKDGLPTGVAIRDLPGGLHYIAGYTPHENSLSQLRQAPAHRNNANASNGFAMQTKEEARDYLLEVLLFIHLSELAHKLELYQALDEKRFWQLARQAVLDYQAQMPQLAARFAQFDLFVPQLRIEKLASRRLSAAQSQEFHRVPNPLHQA
jgi:siderophore synthetase component